MASQTNIPKEQDPIISVDQLCYSYSSKQVLSDIDFEIEENTFTAIVGRSGCGKTTLLNLIAGFLLPTRGQCRFDGNRITHPGPDLIPIFQGDALLPWMRVLDNVMLRHHLAHKFAHSESEVLRAKALLEKVELDPNEISGMYPKSLSAGMRKRVEIARALFAQPRVILADEPFANLDVDTQEALLQLLERIWKQGNLTVLFTTHNLHEALYLASDIHVLASVAPSTIVAYFANEFQGYFLARRAHTEKYYDLFDDIRDAMKGCPSDA